VDYCEKEKSYLRETFSQPFGRSFYRHGIIMFPQEPSLEGLGDFLCSDEPLEKWMPWIRLQFESRSALHAAVEDDAVPYISLATHTGVFAAAFGCAIHVYSDVKPYTPASAIPRIHSVKEADALVEELESGRLKLSLNTKEFDRYFGLVDLVIREFGPDVPIGPVDIQSPFGIAAQIWEKGDFMMALYDEYPEVKILIHSAEKLLVNYLREFKSYIPSPAFCHWPYIWTDPTQGLWLSEDDIGIISPEMFKKWVLPSLERLSAEFGGLFMHCCAAADHQHQNLLSVSGFRGINRLTEYSAMGMGPALQDFAGHLPIISNPITEAESLLWLDEAPEDSMFIFTLRSRNIEDAKAIFSRMRLTLDNHPPIHP